jgi:hypothetical protein
MYSLKPHLRNDLPGVLLTRVPVQLRGHGTELNQEVIRQVFGIDLDPLFLLKADHRRLVLAHDDTGVRAADEQAATTNDFDRSQQRG